ncbi:MAG TPA: hypothetical protein VHD90_17480 [Phototrophicaceae bacterium]|nr:hypothetical protein [Phototrophicaceae bacterium]
MRRVWLFLILWIVSGGVFAQGNLPPLDPVSTLQAGDFRALATTVDGDRLLVADAQNTQVRVYDFRNPAKPSLLTSLDVSGTPVLLVGGQNFGLVAETTDAETDTVEVIAPALPGGNIPYAPGANYISIDKNPRALALSPDNQWGIAVSEHGYTLMHIHSPADIESYEVGQPLIDAALSKTTAYILSDQNLSAAALNDLSALTADKTLALGGTPSLVALDTAAAQGVVVVDDTSLVFFDPTTLQKTGSFRVSGKPITSVHFLSKDADSQNAAAEYLILAQQDANSLVVLDVSDPTRVTALATPPKLTQPIRALTVFDPYMVVTDGVTISIFSA